MTITEQFKAKRCVFSIECFPPKQTTQMDKLKDTLRQMQAMDPGFISVTFGAGGSAGGVSTAEVADYIQNELHVPTLAHLICMGNDETRAAEILDQLESVGVRDVLALRGDRSPSRPESPDFKHASDLTSFIKWKKPEFSVHGACYPEGSSQGNRSFGLIYNNFSLNGFLQHVAEGYSESSYHTEHPALAGTLSHHRTLL